MNKALGWLRKGFAIALVFSLLVSPFTCVGIRSVEAADVVHSGRTTITPNKLTIKWDGEDKSTVIDSFRLAGYNVAQLRTMISALGGSVVEKSDGSYQMTKADYQVSYSDIGFTYEREIDYILNITSIRDVTGQMIYPGQPGWVFLPEYNYNWGSIRDCIEVMDLIIVSVDDDPTNGTTTVVVAERNTENQASDTSDWEEVKTPGSSYSNVYYTDFDYDSDVDEVCDCCCGHTCSCEECTCECDDDCNCVDHTCVGIAVWNTEVIEMIGNGQEGSNYRADAKVSVTFTLSNSALQVIDDIEFNEIYHESGDIDSGTDYNTTVTLNDYKIGCYIVTFKITLITNGESNNLLGIDEVIIEILESKLADHCDCCCCTIVNSDVTVNEDTDVMDIDIDTDVIAGTDVDGDDDTGVEME